MSTCDCQNCTRRKGPVRHGKRVFSPKRGATRQLKAVFKLHLCRPCCSLSHNALRHGSCLAQIRIASRCWQLATRVRFYAQELVSLPSGSTEAQYNALRAFLRQFNTALVTQYNGALPAHLPAHMPVTIGAGSSALR